jgi:catechol 2,3-dioxygenase-like lactoylglutathione lyase family enzyme
MRNTVLSTFEGGLFALTLVTEDLNASVDFYGTKLGLSLVFSDEVSAVYKCGQTMINLLASSAAEDLVAPANVAKANGGGSVGVVYTLRVSDVDAVVAELESAGIELLNGPIDRPWGVRTASFQDPSGHTWELANHA